MVGWVPIGHGLEPFLATCVPTHAVTVAALNAGGVRLARFSHYKHSQS